VFELLTLLTDDGYVVEGIRDLLLFSQSYTLNQHITTTHFLLTLSVDLIVLFYSSNSIRC
jgi:hypothetical protein